MTTGFHTQNWPYVLWFERKANETTFYHLQRCSYGATPKTVLCFSVTRDGFLLGDDRDTLTAERAAQITENRS
jgi:hypothetical protein